MMVDGQGVKPLRIGIKEGRHLIDEGPGAARAGFIHALFHTAGEKGDLGVFPAQFNGDVGIRDHAPDTGGRGDNLLDEGQIHFLRQRYGARSGKREREKRLSSFRFSGTVRGQGHGVQGFGQHMGNRCAHIGKVALITGINRFGIRIENDYFNGGGTYIKTNMGKIARAGHGSSCPGNDYKTHTAFCAVTDIPPCRATV